MDTGQIIENGVRNMHVFTGQCDLLHIGYIYYIIFLVFTMSFLLLNVSFITELILVK